MADWSRPHARDVTGGHADQNGNGTGAAVQPPRRFRDLDRIPDVAYVRSDLAVKEAWKPNIDRVVTYEVTHPVPVKMGPIGPQVDKGTGDYLRGGASQVELDVPAADRMNYLKVVDETPIS